MSFNAFRDPAQQYLPIRRDIVKEVPSTATPFITFGDEVLIGGIWYKATTYSKGTGYGWQQLTSQPGTGGGGSTGITWNTIINAGVPMQPNNGYYMQNTQGLLVMTFGTGFILGSVIEIQCASNFAGVLIQMGATQVININGVQSVPAGTLSLYQKGASLTITCTVADSVFSAFGSSSCLIS